VLPATAGAAPAAASAELAEARAARDRALDEFHRAAATHVAEVRRLQASVAEQASLVAELEEGLEAAEARAASAAVDSATVRRNAKELEEADRARRSRLAELEGKLLRLEHEKKATVEAVTGSEELERKLQAAETARETLRAERDLLRAQLEEASRHQPSRNGEDQAGRALPLPRDLLDELSGIEDGLRQEMRTLSSLELRLADELGQLGRRAAGAGLGEGGSGGGSSVAEEAEVIRLHTTLGNFRRRAARLRDEIEGCRLRMESLSISEISGFLQELGDNLAEFEK
jgi:chromosome segregation ATPase